jgi:hypothetical protein
MTKGKDEKLRRNFRILVAPLDWGPRSCYTLCSNHKRARS